ncbi:MAG: type 4a pilus biogenesis protein PilO [Candidatus Omnitrophota bacterium]
MINLQPLYQTFLRLPKKQKTMLYATGGLLLFSLFNLLIILPVYSKIRSLNEAIRKKEAAIIRDLNVLDRKDEILSESKKYATFLKEALSDEEETTLLLKEIENIASKGSLYIVEMKPSGIKEERNKLKKFVVNLTCEGQMEQVMGFMHNIENAATLLNIDKFQLSPKSKDSSIAQCTMTVSKVVMEDS